MTPLILAHRGSSKKAPENSMKAFELALKDRADGIELDIFLTQDQKVIVTHDENTQRFTQTHCDIRKNTYATIKSQPWPENEPPPLLEDVLINFGKQFSIINIEIKSTGIKTDGIEKKLAQILSKTPYSCEIVVSSFNPLNLLRFKRIMPQIKRGMLFADDNIIAHLTPWIYLINPNNFHFGIDWITDKKMTHYLPYKRDIWLWTLDKKDHPFNWYKYDIKGIITNRPEIWKNDQLEP